MVFGLLVASAAFAVLYQYRSAAHRELLNSANPELAWLRHEFHLSASDLARISQLHEKYLPQCQGRCRVIRAQNSRLRQLLTQASTVTPEIKALLVDRASTRAECEEAMLTHFLEVSHAMAPAQGQRYLGWVERRTLLQVQGMENVHAKLPPEEPSPALSRPWNE